MYFGIDLYSGIATKAIQDISMTANPCDLSKIGSHSICWLKMETSFYV